MNHSIPYLIAVLSFFAAEKAFSQDVNKFSSDENKFSAGFQLSGAFPVGSFTNADISFPCNSSVSTGSAFELSLGYKINLHIGGTLLLSEALYELDPSSRGVAQLISLHPSLYQNAAVFKSGQLSAQSVMVGAFYDLPVGKNNKMFLKSHMLLGIMDCTIPEIEVVGQHNPTAADKNGNSIDTVETWDAPRIYSYFLSYRIGTGLYYSLNKRLSVFVTIDYQGSNLAFTSVPITYNLAINSNNNGAGTSTNLSNGVYTTEVNPTIFYQSVLVGLGCEVSF